MSADPAFIGPEPGQPEVVTPIGGIHVVSIEQFISINEPGAEPLVGEPGAVLIPENGDVMIYGDGGVGKTTLAVDFAYHLAAGQDWLGITIPKPASVLLVENEGPRPLFRDKLRRKHAAWEGEPVKGHLHVVENPWGRISFDDPVCREVLADELAINQTDVLIIGPVTRSGMNEAGTLQDVRDFMMLVNDVRQTSQRRVTVILIHHESKSGQVSGAWEGAGDTLFHVQGQGHGKVRLFVQKARWSTTHHATALQLLWAAGDSFTVEAREEITEESIADEILAACSDNPGASWRTIRDHVKGNADTLAKIRDRLLHTGLVVNASTVPGRFLLWHKDDPAAPLQIGSEAGTDPEPMRFSSPGEGRPDRSGSTVPLRRREPDQEPNRGRTGGTVPEAGTDSEIEVDEAELERLFREHNEDAPQ